MKVNITSDKDHVWISVSLAYGGEDIWFKMTHPGLGSASQVNGVIHERLNRELGDKIESIRREAYLQGVKDARAKVGLLNNFWRCINSSSGQVGYRS